MQIGFIKINIRDLSPLKGIPLTHFDLTDCVDIYDLRPLQSMSSKELMTRKGYARITDMSPLEGKPLTKLVGEDDFYRVRTGDWHIVYQIRDKELLVLVVKVGHQREIYR